MDEEDDEVDGAEENNISIMQHSFSLSEVYKPQQQHGKQKIAILLRHFSFYLQLFPNNNTTSSWPTTTQSDLMDDAGNWNFPHYITSCLALTIPSLLSSSSATMRISVDRDGEAYKSEHGKIRRRCCTLKREELPSHKTDNGEFLCGFHSSGITLCGEPVTHILVEQAAWTSSPRFMWSSITTKRTSFHFQWEETRRTTTLLLFYCQLRKLPSLIKHTFLCILYFQ